MVVSTQRTVIPSILFQTQGSIYYRQGGIPLVQLSLGIYMALDTRHMFVALTMIYDEFIYV